MPSRLKEHKKKKKKKIVRRLHIEYNPSKAEIFPSTHHDQFWCSNDNCLRTYREQKQTTHAQMYL